MNKLYFLLYFIAVTIAAFSQILLKISANKKYASPLKEFLNPIVISAYSILVISMGLTTIALKQVPYKLGGAIESLGYLLVLIFAWIFLKEKIKRKQWIGGIMIIVGIFIFNL